MKNSKVWPVATGGLAVVFWILAAFMIFYSVLDIISREPSQPLINGAVAHFEQGGTHRIFIEDRVPPVLSRHDFAFINTQTGERVESRAPGGSITYDMSGRHGRLVANVTLGPGSYIIEFEPWEGGGVFVWGDDTFSLMFSSTLRIMALGGPAMLFSILFIILLTLHIKRKKDAETEAFYEKINHTGNHNCHR